MPHTQRRYPIGAEVIGKDQTHFRLWAPKVRELDLVLEHGSNSKRTFHSLTPEADGYFSGVANVGSGAWLSGSSCAKAATAVMEKILE